MKEEGEGDGEVEGEGEGEAEGENEGEGQAGDRDGVTLGVKPVSNRSKTSRKTARQACKTSRTR